MSWGVGELVVAAALEAGRTRLRPVLMTALAMIVGMLPMSLGLGEGGEQNAPLGRAVIGGLLFATAATLRTAGSSMITGVIQSYEGRIPLKVKGPQGREQEVRAVVDTGFTASLTLPPAVISALGLQWQTAETFTLADGSTCIFD
jgi:hypothetical protein